MGRILAFPRPHSFDEKDFVLTGPDPVTGDFDFRGGFEGQFSINFRASSNEGNGLDNITVFFSTLTEDADGNLTLPNNTTSGLTFATGQDWSTDDENYFYSLNSYYNSYGGQEQFLHGAGLRVTLTNVGAAGGDKGNVNVSIGRR